MTCRTTVCCVRLCVCYAGETCSAPGDDCLLQFTSPKLFSSYMLRAQLVRWVYRGHSATADPHPRSLLPTATQHLGNAHAYSGLRFPEGQPAEAAQSSEEPSRGTDRLAASRDATDDRQARPPLPGDSNHAASGAAGHWMDRRLPGARRWLQDKSLEWWLRGVQARCKCATFGVPLG